MREAPGTSPSDRAGSHAALMVDERHDRIEVVRSDAPSATAQVIEDQLVRYRTDEHLERHAMRDAGPPRPVLRHVDQAVAVTVHALLPDPAPGRSEDHPLEHSLTCRLHASGI